LSGSRTAAIALFLSIPISGLLIIYKHNIIKLTTKFQFHKSYVILVLTLTFFILLFESKIFNFIEIYLNKTNLIGSGDFVSAYQDSRAVLYEPMINNILQNFFKGIGFGLASDLSNMNVRYFFGIPVSAPIEKGILPLSILEEIGIYGFIFFMIWILIIIGQGIKKDYGSLNIILTFLLFNLGEAGFFSPNGFGMLYLIVITSIITKPKFTKSIN
jgi:hypothetical protein